MKARKLGTVKKGSTIRGSSWEDYDLVLRSDVFGGFRGRGKYLLYFYFHTESLAPVLGFMMENITWEKVMFMQNGFAKVLQV